MYRTIALKVVVASLPIPEFHGSHLIFCHMSKFEPSMLQKNQKDTKLFDRLSTGDSENIRQAILNTEKRQNTFWKWQEWGLGAIIL